MTEKHNLDFSLTKDWKKLRLHMYFGQFELVYLDDIYLILLQFTLFHRKKYEFFLLHSRDLIFGHGPVPRLCIRGILKSYRRSKVKDYDVIWDFYQFWQLKNILKLFFFENPTDNFHSFYIYWLYGQSNHPVKFY